eukprot:TRINITY_DN5972_c0_g1_i2.p1 TRINITY_DN5972_c0_g1~~TRINITY_DN5972_c0_g1_i2.p1  ORF type:complete len:171 (+),score=31.71 TRINITY_DN5972_c0_g1_i2:210-722(+)
MACNIKLLGKYNPTSRMRPYGEYEGLQWMMDSFHLHFKTEHRDILKITAITPLPIKKILRATQKWYNTIEMHHGIEEARFFPIMERKIPDFAKGHREDHKKIHSNLEDLSSYVEQCDANPNLFSLPQFLEKLETTTNILFDHMDREVLSLGPDKLKPYMTAKEDDALLDF